MVCHLAIMKMQILDNIYSTRFNHGEKCLEGKNYVMCVMRSIIEHNCQRVFSRNIEEKSRIVL